MSGVQRVQFVSPGIHPAQDPTTGELWRSRWITGRNGTCYGEPVGSRAATDQETDPPEPGARRAGSQHWDPSVGWITDKRTDDYR